MRYLEFYAFGLVRKALAEREVVLDIAPHISWPQSFILPVTAGQRPELMLRAGLFLYDNLARRREVPGSSRVDLRQDRAGRALDAKFTRAYRYWDGWIDDARLVVANLQDAAGKGATVLPRTGVVSARFGDGVWTADALERRDAHRQAHHQRRRAVGRARWRAACWGPQRRPRPATGAGIAHRLPAGCISGRDAFMLQQPDGRIVFVIPYERDFSLIGTTERDIATPDAAAITEAETDYLLDAANRYLLRPLTRADVVHRFAGVRPLILEPGKGDRETTRGLSAGRT